MKKQTQQTSKDSIENILMRMNKHIKKNDFFWRSDGRLEWVCEHNVGHTVCCFGTKSSFLNWTYGCDGCCKNIQCLKVRIIQQKKQDSEILAK